MFITTCLARNCYASAKNPAPTRSRRTTNGTLRRGLIDWFGYTLISQTCRALCVAKDLETGKRGRWVAWNRQRMGISSVDASEGANQGAGGRRRFVLESGEPFYGTRVGPGWYQSGAGVANGCKLPFSVLRMLMQPSRQPPPCDPLAISTTLALTTGVECALFPALLCRRAPTFIPS